MQMTVLWDAAPCSLVEFYRRFRGVCSFHQHRLASSADTPKMPLNFYQTTRCNNAEDCHLHSLIEVYESFGGARCLHRQGDDGSLIHSEKSVNFHQSTRRSNPVDSQLKVRVYIKYDYTSTSSWVFGLRTFRSLLLFYFFLNVLRHSMYSMHSMYSINSLSWTLELVIHTDSCIQLSRVAQSVQWLATEGATGVRCQTESGDFPSTLCAQPALGPTQPPVQ
jgi:hypothetical protein